MLISVNAICPQVVNWIGRSTKWLKYSQDHWSQECPVYFSKMKSEVLSGSKDYAIPYLNDTTTFLQTWKEHLNQLQDILKRLK